MCCVYNTVTVLKLNMQISRLNRRSVTKKLQHLLSTLNVYDAIGKGKSGRQFTATAVSI